MADGKTTEKSHAEANACGWLQTIRQYVACLEADRYRLAELREERDSYEPSDGAERLEHTECKTLAEQWAFDNPDDADELKELEAAVTVDGEELDRDAISQRIKESPLSVEVRDGWKMPGAESEGPEEYRILLSTGGPALRIVGGLDDHCQPTLARLEHQDWFLPWTELITTESDDKALMAFAACFCFDE